MSLLGTFNTLKTLFFINYRASLGAGRVSLIYPSGKESVWDMNSKAQQRDRRRKRKASSRGCIWRCSQENTWEAVLRCKGQKESRGCLPSRSSHGVRRVPVQSEHGQWLGQTACPQTICNYLIITHELTRPIFTLPMLCYFCVIQRQTMTTDGSTGLLSSIHTQSCAHWAQDVYRKTSLLSRSLHVLPTSQSSLRRKKLPLPSPMENLLRCWERDYSESRLYPPAQLYLH